MKVDLGNDPIESQDISQSYIVGGYASQGWNVSGGTNSATKCKGDSSCFLFNLTQNLRFNAREGMPYYQNVTKDELRFGNTDLVLKGGFQNVTSKIIAPSSGGMFGKSDEKLKFAGRDEIEAMNGSHFCFGNDLT
jgi:hypothetical protein